MKFFNGICVLLAIGLANAQTSKYEKLKAVLAQLAEEMEHNATIRQMWMDHLNLFREPETRDKRPFTCPTDLEPHPMPTSVHKLRLEDIKVVGAMGDSLTAANGADAWTIVGVSTEYRGLSWSIGGDNTFPTTITLPNLLRKYNPDIRGYSTGRGGVTGSGSHLNVAHPGDVAIDMPQQADLLIKRIREDHNINFANDWKLVTLFIGGNDLCDVCHDTNKYSPQNYIKHIRTALDKLHADLPRTFVNLAMIFDITPVAQLGNNFICQIAHNMLCDCGDNEKHHQVVQEHLVEYQRLTQELIDSGRYDTAGKEDFTVVLQPFYKDTVPPHKPGTTNHDLSYFAPDCFHFSVKGHQVAAISLFNNMIEPVGHKSTKWHLNEPYLCPGSHKEHVNDYIPTYKNHRRAGMIGK